MDVAEVLPGFVEAFSFEAFNRMQQETLPAVLGSDDNVVVSAPTASGKTAIAEAAICKALNDGQTALFVAPMRALTSERERDWEGFEELGYSVYVVTGDRELNPRRASHADILVMTPEKVDSATRKHDHHRYAFITDVDLCVIDEVHLLDSRRRGSALEAIVSRLRRLCDPRFVALSATMPNVDDVAAWLDAPPEATFEFDESYRPVDLTADVQTYTHGENAFADKYRRLYRALDIVEPHIDSDGQALVFVASRQDAVEAAKTTRDELASRDVRAGARGDYDFHDQTQVLENDTLRQSVLDGVAFHHAGLSKADRDHIESWFREGRIDLLFSTSTLAWGVNLPARCVVIRDTKYHDPLEGEIEMSPLDVLQMLGRAGRPEYDDVGYGWVICDRSDARRYRRLLEDGKQIESHLLSDLAEHLVAEVALGTVGDLDDVMTWFETTFCYVRAERSADTPALPEVEDRLQETLSTLVDRGFVDTDADLGVTSTPLGRLTSAYYLRLETAQTFQRAVTETDDLTAAAVLEAVATAAEFDDVTARSDEIDAIDAVLGDRGTALDGGNRKVLAILHAGMSGTLPTELRSDAWIIRQNALRLMAAFGAICREFGTPREANRVSRIEARIEHGVGTDAVGLTAIDGVGQKRANALADAGFDRPRAIAEAPREALARADVSSGVVDRLQEAAAEEPNLRIEWPGFPDRIPRGENALEELRVYNAGGGATIGIRVTVNGVEMTRRETYVGRDATTTVPVGVYGGDPDTMTYAVTVTTPEKPLRPVTDERRVRVV